MNENKAVIVGLTLAASCPLSADVNQQANPLSLDRRTRMEIKVDQSLQSSFVRYLEVNGRIQVTDRLQELKQLPPMSIIDLNAIVIERIHRSAIEKSNNIGNRK